MPNNKLTLAQEYQTFLFGLLQTHVMNLEGPVIENEENLPVVHISREAMVDKLLMVLNEFGEAVAKDERFKHEAQ